MKIQKLTHKGPGSQGSIPVSGVDMTDTQWEKKLKIRSARSRNHEMDGENSPYEPTPYSVLERLADSGYLSKANVLVDYGCGKGRASIFLAHKTGCRVIGIDYNQHIIEEAEANRRHR